MLTEVSLQRNENQVLLPDNFVRVLAKLTSDN